MNNNDLIASLQASLAKEQAARITAEAAIAEKDAELAAACRQVAQLSRQLQEKIETRTEEIRQYNEQLVVTSNRLSQLMQNLQYGVVLVDEHQRILLANNRLCEIFNTLHNPAHLTGMDCRQAALHLKEYFKDPEAFADRVLQLLEEKQPVMGEQLVMLNGRIIHRDYIPIWNKGRYEGHLWVYIDITEKVQTEKKLNDQRQFYEDILNLLPGDVVVMNPQREYLFLNPEAVRDEHMRQWLIGKKEEDYFRMRQHSPGIAQRRIEIIEEVLRTRTLKSWEEKLVLPDGSIQYHQRNIYPALDEEGNVKLLIGFGSNITGQRNIEEQTVRSEKRYHDLFRFSQALICTHDVHGRLLSVNPALYQLLGYEAEEMTGHMIYDYMPEEDKALFLNRYLHNILQTGKDDGVFKVRCKSGRLIFLLYQNFKVEENGVDTYIIGFAQDITNRIQIERELRAAKQETEEAAKAKEIFLANMSHEIRTPMNGVLGMASLLSKTNLDSQQQKYLRLIQESAHNLLKIVNDVLDLEKIILGKLQFEEVAFSLSERVETCVQSFTFKAEEKDISLFYRNRLKRDITVIGDPHRLSQVLNNLLNNALKFTEAGIVSIETTVTEERDGKIFICFSVHDTGVGIPEEKLQSIFEPFMQAHSSISRRFGGTGLGLSICRELIQLLGGRLQVESKENEGSVFSFILPFKTSTVKPMQAAMVQETNYRNLGKKRILLAEDVELNQYLARHIMESWGLEVAVAGNGREAVEMVQQHDYDLVLMDIQMPEMDGIEATRIIRQLSDKRKSAVPIVALTANALKGDSEKYMAAGMNGYVSKPFDESKLYHMISGNLNPETTAPVTDRQLQAVAVPDGQLYNLEMIQAISGGDQHFIKRMIVLFIDSMPQSVQEMQQQVRQENWEATGKLAHKIKSTIDSMGIASLKEDIRTIESNGKKNERTAEIPALVQKVSTIIEQCIVQLKKDFSLN